MLYLCYSTIIFQLPFSNFHNHVFYSNFVNKVLRKRASCYKHIVFLLSSAIFSHVFSNRSQATGLTRGQHRPQARGLASGLHRPEGWPVACTGQKVGQWPAQAEQASSGLCGLSVENHHVYKDLGFPWSSQEDHHRLTSL